jgi:phenylalanyl-tRNA synthetase beta subunit
LGWNDSRGFQVYVGSDLQDITAKMNMIEEIVKTLTKANIQPTLISVEQINAPYYRLD